MNAKYEYREERLLGGGGLGLTEERPEALLKRVASEGWELVSVVGDTHMACLGAYCAPHTVLIFFFRRELGGEQDEATAEMLRAGQHRYGQLCCDKISLGDLEQVYLAMRAARGGRA